MLTDLVIASINTGTWPAMIAVVVILICITTNGKIIYAGPFFMLPPVYINSVMGNLNIRTYIHSQAHERSIVGGVSSIKFRTKRTTGQQVSHTIDRSMSVYESNANVADMNSGPSGVDCPTSKEQA